MELGSVTREDPSCFEFKNPGQSRSKVETPNDRFLPTEIGIHQQKFDLTKYTGRILFRVPTKWRKLC